MRSINIDKDWKFGLGMGGGLAAFFGGNSERTVNLPHDYMIESDVREDAPAGASSGFFTAGVAHYTKTLHIPAEWEGDEIFLKFDGIMMNATVEVNGDKAALQHYGYAPFAVNITRKVYCGKDNLVNIIVNPSMQPNSRWYSGAGIYRSVELVHTPKVHIANDGIFGYTRTIDYDGDGTPLYANVQTAVEVENASSEDHIARVEVFLTRDGSDEVIICRSQKLQINAGTVSSARIVMNVANPVLWDAEHPELYRLHARVTDLGIFKTHHVPCENGTVDETDVLFGIKTVAADAVHGLRINGKSVKLKGGCIHHDNGMLGTVSLYDSEFRKLSNLKKIGFNAVRTTHNPPSAVLMEACDRLGMYVFDEAFDAWGMMKQPGDYNMFFETDWEKDLTLFMKRDRNHPSVVIWSTGNEITERAGLNNGYVLAEKLAEKMRSLDPSRPISNAICSFWNGLDTELMVENARKMKEQMEKAQSGDADLQNADTAKTDLSFEELTEAFSSSLDIFGYNYQEDRYEQDHVLYPDRVILGSENFPKEIGFRWPLVESRPCYIGDFTWTAYDYLGEAGIGKTMFFDPEDKDSDRGLRAFSSHVSSFPWRLANDADVDINGGRMPQGDYRSVVWGSPATYVFSYDPDNFGKEEVISQWGFITVRRNWTWPGKEGKPVQAVVFSGAEEVALFLNGEEIGRQKAGERECPKLPKSFLFDVPAYTPGTLLAVSLNGGAEVSRAELATVNGEAAALRVTPERTEMAADGHSVTYVAIEIVNAGGQILPDAALPMTASLEAENGAAVLAGFGSSNPITAENYTRGEFTSYRGRAWAIVRSGYEAGEARLEVKAGALEGEAVITVK